ncbi:MAG: SPOR domain-containing protein [Hyphomonadaceae bacterium]
MSHEAALEEEDHPRRQTLLFAVAFVVLAAFSGFVWNLYAGGETPRISAPPGDYKIQPAAGAELRADAAESALYDALEGRGENADVHARAGPEEPLTQEEISAEEIAVPPPQRESGAPEFSHSGPYVAQIAAIQAERGVDAAWRRLASRAPDLFAHARMDVERADLGARGIYFRVRAGYFDDRGNAQLFCDRVRAMGQDCIVVSR